MPVLTDTASARPRAVGWEGFINTRDLGGLPTRDGRTTRYGVFYRSADPRFVTDAGWAAARAAGLRTVVDLRNDDEIRPGPPSSTGAAGTVRVPPPVDGPATPPDLSRVEVPIDDVADVALWQRINISGLNGTPLYFRPFLEAKPGRVAAAICALAQATPGGVLFHCAAGRDRTGLIALLLETLADVEPEAIADNYGRSATALVDVYARVGLVDQNPRIDAQLAAHGTTARQAVLDLVAEFDAETYLLAGGGSGAGLDRLTAADQSRSSRASSIFSHSLARLSYSWASSARPARRKMGPIRHAMWSPSSCSMGRASWIRPLSPRKSASASTSSFSRERPACAAIRR
ncbi:tyrosine-protein phosphatase [Frankia sp. AgB1.9]|nr:tyrosine-protein phosphatase [Frankia sp. AgW1.1]MBL7546695.1 tyrosine-protein phosphatase [Frankia sp. AgB1.9]